MKTLPCIVLGFFLLTAAHAGDARYETVTGTNSITIADYETAELVSVLSTNLSNWSPDSSYVRVTKSGYVFQLHAAASQFMGNIGMGSVGDTVRGPATFQLYIPNQYTPTGFTLKITPVSFPPNQTLIVPPGTNQVQISMESSTNLVNWATATNGVYGRPDEARFFRLKMTNLQP